MEQDTWNTAAATWNIGVGPDDRKAEDLDKIRRHGVILLGPQEAGDRGEMLGEWCTANGWRMHRPRLPGAGSVPILFDPEALRLDRARTVIAVARRFVGAGAGPSIAKPKAINVAVFEIRATGKRVRFLNTHFVASATRQGKAYDARRRHYRAHALVLARMIRARVDRTVVAMDANAEIDFPLLSPVRATGLSGWSRMPTHGKRSIDHLLGPGQGLGSRFVVFTSSDHTAVGAPLFRLPDTPSKS
jgi:hypothetical protein